MLLKIWWGGIVYYAFVNAGVSDFGLLERVDLSFFYPTQPGVYCLTLALEGGRGNFARGALRSSQVQYQLKFDLCPFF